METFGQRLRSLREKDEQEKMAEIMGVAPNTLGNYERDRNQPKFENIWRVCSHFGICAEWLIFGSGPKFQNEVKLPPVTTDKNCLNCVELKNELAKEREERRDLSAENRQLWRENGELKAQVAELKTKLDNLAPPVSKQPHENSAKTA